MGEQFKDKVVLITGGSRGLGRAMAEGFAAEGAKLAIVSRKLESCEQTRAALVEAYGSEVFVRATHVGDWDDLGVMVDEVIAHFGRIDVLINNAGMSPLYPALSEISEVLFDKVVGVNLKGPFRLMASVGDKMMQGEGGSIINISSSASVTKSPNSEPYGAAKAGLNALTRSFAAAYGPKVRVNCIMAGPFLTDISEAWDMAAFNERAESSIPLQRGGEAVEIVAAALYFAGPGASFTTGALLAVDGGSH
ncbi:MAG: SDR family NAD(P)-dependent oxidoreductase [Pseudomonadales bacterium]|jgi:NAD(P)-dependent dehydrogenase (short-subunit alcohol dehydrogenase family)|nr:SDR family oxidoreductase [Gammaproteobacteria bacterium]MDG1925146.1 SDR family NAD(P)-dependent oxidoreductase [Pseudomonadales bacterium]